MKKILSVLLGVSLLFQGLSIKVLASENDLFMNNTTEQPISSEVQSSSTGYSYIDENGELKFTGSTKVTPIKAIQPDINSGWYVFDDGPNFHGFKVYGHVHLILKDDIKINIKGSIEVYNGGSLTIYGQSKGTGQLSIIVPYYYGDAAIGGSEGKDFGDITINGGKINAYSVNSAAIGNAYGLKTGKITINGGTIKAVSRDRGAGIDSKNITINGGNITAKGSHISAGIGGYSVERITINGGDIVARGGSYGGAGIGTNEDGSGGTIVISGGRIHATGDGGGAGIGAGKKGKMNRIYIDGGIIKADNSSGDYGIRADAGNYNNGSIVFAGGTTFTSRISFSEIYISDNAYVFYENEYPFGTHPECEPIGKHTHVHRTHSEFIPNNILFGISVPLTGNISSYSPINDLFFKLETHKEVTRLTESSVHIKGSVDVDSNHKILERGFVYGTSPNPVITKSGVKKIQVGSGVGDFSATLKDLTQGKKYFGRAYARYDQTTYYGADIEFVPWNPDLAYINEIGGLNRYSTALEISRQTFKESKTVILASGENFPDAITAGILSYKYNAPILLTAQDVISEEVLIELERLKATDVFILGGNQAVSYTFEDELNYNGIENVSRIGGSTRYETAVNVAEHFNGGINGKKRIFITNGENFPDAIAASGISTSNGIPILLTESDSLNEYTKGFLNTNNFEEIIILGGNIPISSKVEKELQFYSPKVTRIYGENRYSTAIELAKTYYDDFNSLIIASGENFPDALVAGSYSAKNKAPILLTQSSRIPNSLEDYLNSIKLDEATILGGNLAISKASRVNLISIIQKQ